MLGIYDLTPVEEIIDFDSLETMKFKREDKFAPFGLGGINGSKLRQCIWLAAKAKDEGYTSMVNGTVVGSPQSAMGTAVFKYFGMDVVTVLGATRPDTCLRHPMIQMAAWFGSKFDFVGSAYNSTIQPRCQAIRDIEESFYLEYGITLDHKYNPKRDVSEFHRLGGEQVKNIPKGVTDLVIPFGSANSACSILTGIMDQNTCKDIERIHLIGIGPDKTKYLQERIDLIGSHIYTQFTYGDMKKWVDIRHHDLHGTDWVKYNDLMPENFGGIDLHPRYEGKVMRYLKQELPHLIKPSTLFWIVGSEPTIEPMKKAFPDLGEIPKEIELYESSL